MNTHEKFERLLEKDELLAINHVDFLDVVFEYFNKIIADERDYKSVIYKIKVDLLRTLFLTTDNDVIEYLLEFLGFDKLGDILFDLFINLYINYKLGYKKEAVVYVEKYLEVFMSKVVKFIGKRSLFDSKKESYYNVKLFLSHLTNSLIEKNSKEFEEMLDEFVNLPVLKSLIKDRDIKFVVFNVYRRVGRYLRTYLTEVEGVKDVEYIT